MLVGTNGQDVSFNSGQGRAYLFSGDGSLLLTLDHPNPQEFARFGVSVAGVGDINGDGVPDMLVGAHLQDVGGNSSQGRAYLFSGDGSLLLTLDHPNPQAGASFGASVAGVGDTNGDGVPDMLVGAPFQDVDGNSAQGQAFLVSVLVINTKSRGNIPVAVLSNDQLDATTIDVSTVAFGPDAAAEAHNRLHLQDLNSDGLLDAVFHFKTQETGIASGDKEACILFETTDEIFLGCDPILTVQ